MTSVNAGISLWSRLIKKILNVSIMNSNSQIRIPTGGSKWKVEVGYATVKKMLEQYDGMHRIFQNQWWNHKQGISMKDCKKKY